MRPQRGDERPAWWLFYGLWAMLVALIGIAEVFVPNVVARRILEVSIVVLVFPLLLAWVSVNRTAIEEVRIQRRPPAILEPSGDGAGDRIQSAARPEFLRRARRWLESSD